VEKILGFRYFVKTRAKPRGFWRVPWSWKHFRTSFIRRDGHPRDIPIVQSYRCGMASIHVFWPWSRAMKKDRHETIESTNDQKIARGVSKISGSLSINPMNTTIYIYIYIVICKS
jgi:hypothetical protein